MPLLRMPALPGNLHASGVGRQTHPPARVSAVPQAHDNVGAAGRGVMGRTPATLPKVAAAVIYVGIVIGAGIAMLLPAQAEPDDFLEREDVVRGIGTLGDFNLTYDILVYPRQLSGALSLVDKLPDQPFVVDHLAKPQIRDGEMEPWAAQMIELASCPNVWCKMSGLVTEADHNSWTEEDLRPYIDQVIDCFGFNRVMYGGDWPVAYQATEYPRWVATLEHAVSGCSDEELRKLFRDNAIEFYRLD